MQSRVAGQRAGGYRREDYRDVALATLAVTVEETREGVIYVHPVAPLGRYPDKLTDRLDHWAIEAPDRTFIARRGPDGEWIRVSYAQTRATVRRLAQALIDRKLSPERPLVILSGNDIEHAMLGLAASYAGVPYAPISPAYSTISSDFAKLRHIVNLLTPGMVFAADGDRFGKAIEAVIPPETEIVVTANQFANRACTLYSELAGIEETEAVDAAHAAVGPDTIAKLLFTSGSTGLPKGVINTQRMLCSNQVMLNGVLEFLKHEPPVIVDWLPWNHTFGGNHNVGLILFNGGTLYIDDGKPVPGGIKETIRNLREISPTVYFNVPKGWETLVDYLRAEPDLRKTFFANLKLNFFAGAGLAKPVWDALDDIAVQETGKKIVMLTGLGATESAPFALSCGPDTTASGHVGVPVPGQELKLVPMEGKLEARLKGPNITPGYWRDPENTKKSYDEEGFYKLGDALAFIDRQQPNLGFRFDGRVTEDFKLATGTWVSVGPLRANFINHFAPYARDVVVAGINRDDITGIVIPDVDVCRRLAPDLPKDAEASAVLNHDKVRAEFAFLLTAMSRESTGSSTRFARLIILEDQPSIDVGEITDKGSINQRAVLAHRAEMVEELYQTPRSPRVIEIAKG
ncbi:feruloyl-CoA synthase [Breoghania sp. L-A4]|uniref:feruloyl-CoA synthase n=1 Tax=Breoghania sp. L-A4 TaxID=2304600 RepID=UPI000E35F5BF|nr:feruloyl-CoA synthase [Breoghania sp. L-A4]AXS42229.1 feruloyl-CoA synthase [Breoghania sp. L-A4]